MALFLPLSVAEPELELPSPAASAVAPEATRMVAIAAAPPTFMHL